MSLEQRARIQGRVDVAIAIAGAAGGLTSGLIVASASYAALAVGSGIVAMLVLTLALRASPNQPHSRAT